MFVTEIRTDQKSIPVIDAVIFASGTCRVVEHVGKLVNGEARWSVFVEHPYSWSLESLLIPVGYLSGHRYGYMFHAKSGAKSVI